jgi:serpin B
MKHLVWKLLVTMTLLSLVGCGPATVAVEREASPTVEREASPTVEREASPTVEREAAPTVEREVLPAADVARSDVERETLPAVPDADLARLAAGNSAFAFDLYQALREGGPDNLFYSPYSISIALAMTYAGARGETERQMAETMHFADLAQEALHPAFNRLDQVLAARGQGAAGKKEGEGFRLHIANALWGQQGYPFLEAFLDTLARNYGAGLRLVDYIQAAEQARVTINDWIAAQTEDRIKDLIPPGAIDSMTRLVLTNAIYFNAAWQFPFDEARTADGPFTRIDGSQVQVPMMQATESFGYAAGEGYQAVDLLYDGGELSMVVLLPAEGAFDAFQAALDAGQVSGILRQLSRQQVALTMPKFEFESEFQLASVLQGMGMTEAFNSSADFSGMTGTRELFISDVIHKAFVAVDESGTEAAAATAVIMKFSAVPAEPVQVSVDRPFIFLIRDIETGTILFVGRVMDPSA